MAAGGGLPVLRREHGRDEWSVAEATEHRILYHDLVPTRLDMALDCRFRRSARPTFATRARASPGAPRFLPKSRSIATPALCASFTAGQREQWRSELGMGLAGCTRRLAPFPGPYMERKSVRGCDRQQAYRRARQVNARARGLCCESYFSVACRSRILDSVPVEPGKDRAGLGGGLAGPGGDSVVARSGHFDERRRDAAQLQRLVILLRLAVGCPVVLGADDDERWRLDVADEAERRARPIAGRILPRLFREPVRREECRDVGSEPEARPVDHRLLRRRGAEAVRLADDPRGQHAAARSAGHEEIAGIDVPARDCRVDRAHQVVIIVARISLVDLVRELLAIGGRAARVGVKDDISRRRVELVVGRELRTVSGERTAVDL